MQAAPVHDRKDPINILKDTPLISITGEGRKPGKIKSARNSGHDNLKLTHGITF